MLKLRQRDLIRYDRRDHDDVAGAEGFVQRIMRLCLRGCKINNRTPPIVSWRANNYRAPVNFLDFSVVSVGDLGSVPHDTQPRGRQEHYAIAGIAVKAENDLTVLLAFCGTQADAVKPQGDSDFLHITSILPSPCAGYTPQPPPAI